MNASYLVIVIFLIVQDFLEISIDKFLSNFQAKSTSQERGLASSFSRNTVEGL
jgi:hypothetical protein